jgi:hypothetical protein
VIAAFGCRAAVYGYNTAPGDTFLVMTGTRPALDALGVLLPQVAIGMETEACAATRAHIKASPGGHRALYFRDYLRGYGRGVAERLRALRTEMYRSEGAALASVIAADDARVEQLFTQEFPAAPPLRQERTSSRAAQRVGVAAGRAAKIDAYLAIHDLVFAML